MSLTDTVRRNINRNGHARVGDVLSDLHGVITATLTTSGTANATTNYAHGLKDIYGNAIAPYWVGVQGDGYVASWDATNIAYASNNNGAKSITLLIVPQPGDNYAAARKTDH